MRDLYRRGGRASSSSASSRENTNTNKQCTTPGSCGDETEYMNAIQEQNDLRQRLKDTLQYDKTRRGDNIRDNEEGMDLRAKLNARLGIKNNDNSGPSIVQSHQEGGAPPRSNKPNNPNFGSHDFMYDIPGEDPGFLQYLSSLEIYEVPEMREALEQILAEMEVDVGGITTLMQRHVERTLIQHQFPEGGEDTNKYATFGSLLDVSTDYSVSWNGSTEFGGKPSWVASIFYRKDIIQYEDSKPCRVDLKDDYDAELGDDECCLLGVTIDDYVGIRPSKEKKEEHMILSAYWDILDHGQWRVGSVMNLEFGNRKFDTIVANGALTGEDDEVVAIMEKFTSLLNPGGIVFFVGIEPIGQVDGPEKLYNEILREIESAKRVSFVSTYFAYDISFVPSVSIEEHFDSFQLITTCCMK